MMYSAKRSFLNKEVITKLYYESIKHDENTLSILLYNFKDKHLSENDKDVLVYQLSVAGYLLVTKYIYDKPVIEIYKRNIVI